tara:strand:+ start:823 stop:1476 length:654 start_codon:yes stop_codon:yes gene_type:complete
VRKDTKVRKLSVLQDSGDYNTRNMEGGVSVETREFMLWYGLNRRAKHKYSYSDKCYANTTVSGKFKNYNYFVVWAKEQTGFHEKGWCLDKDILCWGGDKVYSESTCVFIPISINSFLTFSHKSKNLSGYTGVSWQSTYTKSKGKFIVSCAMLDGKNKTLGRTDDAYQGYLLYRQCKVQLAVTLAEKYKDRLDERVYKFLCDFDKHIDTYGIFAKEEE